MTTLLMLILTPVVGQLEPGDHTRSVEVGSLTQEVHRTRAAVL